jgi:hypothetical protein
VAEDARLLGTDFSGTEVVPSSKRNSGAPQHYSSQVAKGLPNGRASLTTNKPSDRLAPFASGGCDPTQSSHVGWAGVRTEQAGEAASE